MKTIPTLYIGEYQSFGKQDLKKCLATGQEHRADKIWEALKHFASQERNQAFLRFKNSDTLAAQNYVGVIQLKNFCIEILPKIHKANLSGHSKDCPQKLYPLDRLEFIKKVRQFINQEGFEFVRPTCSLCYARQILLNCLSTLKDTPFKKSSLAHLTNASLPLLEIFVRMFLEECEQLIKRGLKRDYLAISENRLFFKGKLEFASHLKTNLIHKERFYTTSDTYSLDVPPNRLIKSTLKILKSLALSPKSQEKLNSMWFVLDGVCASQNIESDFAKSKLATRFKEYENLLAWCNLFLRQKSLTPHSGTDYAYAFLFPMEKLFESFVGFWLQKSLGDIYTVSLQEQKYDFIKDRYLRPDIILRSKQAPQNECCILDTKWKKVQGLKDVSYDDLYQMWAYASTYATLEQTHISTCLVYPLQDGMQSTETFRARPFTDEPVKLKIAYFPLDNHDHLK
ncbi:mcrBC 5-methylcytosine restriction system component [Helicobacter suis]|uniref:McrBC 5-methylcytosine restriction system component n=1 Tax=Helicobacter suis TaxID=104628 RepID=A0ABM7L1X7_9HELI|nr:McrC family protein [Helicobacter suis]BCD46699.1 mcrBC 5-methylcytosine restriction system component [Helicobacter suis]